jgi:predicted P-loop ATPase
MGKNQQDELKDVGGFVGGTLRGGRRNSRSVTGRDLVTLDLDAITAGQTRRVISSVSVLGCATCIYSTRKHDPEHPRLRILIPLDRTVTAEEYEPIARRLAEYLGIEQCDPTTFEACRLMFWPSASSDSEFVFDVNDAPFAEADKLLGTYQDWHDMREWPQVPGTEARIQRAQQAEDPETKEGIVGAFCEAYPIRRVLTDLIPGAYLETDDPDRFTFSGGHTTAGAIIYQDKWMYSHHATDPAGGRLCNAWDLARLHLFGDKDSGEDTGGAPSRLPSYRAMVDRFLTDPDVKRVMSRRQRESLARDFGDSPDPDGDWMQGLEFNQRGEVTSTLANLRLIFDFDPNLQCIGTDTFLRRKLVRGALPWDDRTETREWTDDDDTGAAWYMETAYRIKDLRRIKMAADMAISSKRTDVLQEYLEGLVWDGVPRVDTLLERYFKADATPYVRAVCRKTLVAAVARAMEPGVKFDNVMTLIGAQGTAKSMFAAILGGDWYSDTLQTFSGKEAAEELRGTWIMEIPEVDRFFTKTDVAQVKQFITRTDDIFREAYARHTTSHPRRCVFIATTNVDDFLQDITGNRRWWVVQCHTSAQDRGEDMASLRRDRDQIWAEAMAMWRTGEPLALGPELYQDAVEAQTNALEEDPWRGDIEEFVSRKVPPDWAHRSPDARVLWWSDEFGQSRDTDLVERDRICVPEIWVELYGQNRARLDRATARRIYRILATLPDWSACGTRRTIYGNQKCFKPTTLVVKPDF